MQASAYISSLLIASLALSACSTAPPVEPSYQQQVSECARIADRGERTRCLDAAHRTAGRPKVNPGG